MCARPADLASLSAEVARLRAELAAEVRAAGRPSEAARVAALDAALAAVELAPDAVDANPSARAMYNRFVSPRAVRAGEADAGVDAPGRQPLETLARAAAHNIAHTLRRDAAEAAAYIRTCDAAHAEAEALALPTHPLALVLDNLRSAYNVGSLLRTADTARCAEVVTCGYCPHPPHAKIDKTAFNAARSVRTRHFEATAAALRALRAEGYALWAMETTERSLCYASAAPLPPRLALVLGNEEVGVDPAVLEMCDALVEVPTFGVKNSLNVASAAPIVVFDVLRRWGRLPST